MTTNERIMELSRMSKAELRIEEERVLRKSGLRRIWQAGPASKDELISSILRLERGDD